MHVSLNKSDSKYRKMFVIVVLFPENCARHSKRLKVKIDIAIAIQVFIENGTSIDVELFTIF